MKRPPPKRKPVVIVRHRIIRRTKRDHGAWKVAFADFTTAMMAFFLLLWLLTNASVPEKLAVSGYFVEPGGAFSAGGADSGLNDSPDPSAPGQLLARAAIIRPPANDGGAPTQQLADEQLRQQYQQQEMETLEKLRQKLLLAIDSNDSVFEALKGQITIDINMLGLRVQISDKAQRPMFDLGRDELKNYTEKVLRALAPLLDSVPNRISITGHTDAFRYGDGAMYSNWELSADRANSARRALVSGGYPEEKIAAVQGMGDTALFKPDAPLDPSNRRIAIIVLRRVAEKSIMGSGDPQKPSANSLDGWR